MPPRFIYNVAIKDVPRGMGGIMESLPLHIGGIAHFRTRWMGWITEY